MSSDYVMPMPKDLNEIIELIENIKFRTHRNDVTQDKQVKIRNSLFDAQKILKEQIKQNLSSQQTETSSGGKSKKARKIHTGPNGGKYVIKNGKKVYVK